MPPPRLALNLPQYKRYDYIPPDDLVEQTKAAAYRTGGTTSFGRTSGAPSIGSYDYNSLGQVSPNSLQRPPPELQPIQRYESSLQTLQELPDASESIGESYQNQIDTILQGGRNATDTIAAIVQAKQQEAARLQQQKLYKALVSSRSRTGAVNGASLGSTGGMVFGGKAASELDTIGKRAVAIASTALGTWYKFGGTNLKTGVDCSGLIQTVYARLGIRLPRVSIDQARSGKIIGRLDRARPGDIVVMNSPVLGHNRHVALYAGNGWMIEAAHTGTKVRRTRLRGYNFFVRPY